MESKAWHLFFCIKTVICFVILFILLLFELKTRAMLNVNNNNGTITSKHTHYMKISSLMAIYCCIINCIFILLIKIPWNICSISISGCLLSWTLRHAAISIYQCVRLQLIFDKNHNGYPNWIYYILFGYSFIATIITSMSFIIVPNFMYPNTYSLSQESDNNHYYGHGCKWNVTIQESMLILIIGIGLCIPGFILVLLMYTHKLNILKYNELQKKKEKRLNYDISVLQNIIFISSKIKILSGLYIIPIFLMLIIMAFDLKFWNYMLGDLDCLISGFIIWFMMEHNNDKYKKFCCCCKELKDKQASDKYKDHQLVPNEEDEEGDIESNTTNIMPGTKL